MNRTGLIQYLSCTIVLLVMMMHLALAQQVIPLYSGSIPNARPATNEEFFNADHSVVFKVSVPTLSIYLPPKNQSVGTAVIICPGGGYHALVIDREGYEMAQRLNKYGIAAFVLKYRLPEDRTMIDKSIGPLQDAQEAIKLVRLHAAEWGVDTAKIGIMGFSAGGHLASTAATHFDRAFINNKEKMNLRPDFMILVYPVVSMTDSLGHKGSRNYLLGENPSVEQINRFSNERHVNRETPPAFIVQAEDDSVVMVENAICFYQALHANSIPVAMHIYQKGGHGFLHYPPRDVWMNDLIYWMKTNALLPSD